MMSKKRPQLRFGGFTDDWEEHKLGDFLKTPEKVKAHIQSKDDLMTLKLNLGGLESGSNRETLELGSTIYYKRKAGQFIYGKQNFFNGSMAIIPIDLDGKATSGDVPSLDVIGILSEYLYVYVSRGDYWKSKESEASGTGSKRIHEKTLQGFDIKVPSTQNEQRKIGSFFKQLDDTIALHQRKLDLLKEQKKGFLQKMFPKNGEKVPELRFEGFADDWEQRKWIDTVDISTNMVNPKTGDYDDLLHIGPGNIESFTGRILDNVNTVKNDNLISGKFHFNPNDIIYGKINPQLAKYVHVDFEGLASADAYVLNSKNGVNQGFLFVELQTSGFYKYSVSVSMRTGMPKINRDELNQFSYLAPKNIEEQQRIGSFFKQLDETIALHQRKLDLLKEQKKGYLQKMFV
ncbi:restriction endonuclease subunit S [Lactococcus petauri]|uniref:restriction endonuclease subunit S n=1 Tax=Lactococcus petauri TaxID=1940789 RepID=UPI0038545267